MKTNKIIFSEFINFYKVMKNLKSRNIFLYNEILKIYGDFNAKQYKEKIN